jgi:hypothetical protein
MLAGVVRGARGTASGAAIATQLRAYGKALW